MTGPIPILYLDPPPLTPDLVGMQLLQSKLPLQLHRAHNEAEFLRLLPQQDWQVIIAQVHPEGFDGFEALKRLKSSQHDIPLLLLSAYPGEQMAVRAIKAGAYDYLPLRQLSRLLPCLSRILLERQSPNRAPADNLAQLSLLAMVDALVLINTDGSIKLMNETAQRLSGWTQAQAHGKPVTEVLSLFHEHGERPLMYPDLDMLTTEQPRELPADAAMRHRNGTTLLIEGSIAPIRNLKGYILGLVLSFRDVSLARQLSMKLSFDATHDCLTGLVNRREFELRLERLLARNTGQTGGALLFMDLDHFKVINDTSGHLAGDALLCQITQLLQSQVRERDTLARLGGDEFALLMENCTLEQATRVAEHLLQTLKNYHFHWQQQEFQVGISIGIVSLESPGQDPQKLLELADHACYIAKSSGRNRYLTYSPQNPQLLQQTQDAEWLDRLQQALVGNGFELLRQRILSVNPDQPSRHSEMLLRYRTESGELCLPSVFLPIAERHQLLPAIDRWVVRNSLDWLSRHPEQAQAGSLCSINLSADSLNDDAIPLLLDLLQNTDLPLNRLCFEISELQLRDDFEHYQQQLFRLKQLGCQLALDQFGQGLASCSYLSQLPVDLLKIDGNRIENLPYSQSDWLLTKAINEASHILGKTTVASSVSSRLLQTKVQELGIDRMQGFHLERPRPLA